MDIRFISIQGSYKTLEIALFEKKSCIDSIKEDNKKASATLIPHIEKLLTRNNLSITDLSFIAITQGPGAFTSLRVAITTVNAISFATQIPLVGIDGILALAHETGCTNEKLLVLLNAYNQDVYYGLFDKDLNPILGPGYENIDILLSKIEGPVSVVGNAAKLFEEKIRNKNSEASIIDTKEASALQVGLLALEKWNNQETSQKLMPLYLKSQNFKPKY